MCLLRKLQHFHRIVRPFNRYSQAERDLKQAQPFGDGPKKFYDVDQINSTKEHPKKLMIAMTSERGNFFFGFKRQRYFK